MTQSLAAFRRQKPSSESKQNATGGEEREALIRILSPLLPSLSFSHLTSDSSAPSLASGRRRPHWWARSPRSRARAGAGLQYGRSSRPSARAPLPKVLLLFLQLFFFSSHAWVLFCPHYYSLGWWKIGFLGRAGFRGVRRLRARFRSSDANAGRRGGRRSSQHGFGCLLAWFWAQGSMLGLPLDLAVASRLADAHAP